MRSRCIRFAINSRISSCLSSLSLYVYLPVYLYHLSLSNIAILSVQEVSRIARNVVNVSSMSFRSFRGADWYLIVSSVDLGYSGVLRVRVRAIRRFSGDSERFRVILSSFSYKMTTIFYVFLILNSWKARAHRDLCNGVLRIFLASCYTLPGRLHNVQKLSFQLFFDLSCVK